MRKSFFANSVIVERGPLGNTPLFGMGLSCKMCACAPPPSPSWKKLQQWPWNCIAAVGTGTSCGSKGNSPPQPSPRPLSSSRSQIKAYQMEEEGELQFATAFFCTLLLPLQKRSLSPKKESQRGSQHETLNIMFLTKTLPREFGNWHFPLCI